MDLFSTPLVLAFIRLKRPHDRRPRPEGSSGPPCPRPTAAVARGQGQQGAAGFLFWSGGARVHVPMQGGGLHEEYWWEEAQIQSNIAE